MMLLFGLTYDEWLKVGTWAESHYGSPRYMSAVRSLLWCKLKWEQANRPALPDKFSSASAWRLHDALCAIPLAFGPAAR